MEGSATKLGADFTKLEPNSSKMEDKKKNEANKEIAEIVGVPTGTIMSRLHRGRKQLREKLTDYARELGYVKGGKK